MSPRSLALAVVLAMTAASAEENGDASAKDLRSLQGIWQMQRAIHDGRKESADEVAKVRLVIEGKKLTMYYGPYTGDGAIAIDTDARPPAIDLALTKGPQEKGIYSVDGDRLKLCFARSGNSRPKDFDSKPGSGTSFMVFRRVQQ
jgi:uncharacterized protein (TIGR03067 family)